MNQKKLVSIVHRHRFYLYRYNSFEIKNQPYSTQTQLAFESQEYLMNEMVHNTMVDDDYKTIYKNNILFYLIIQTSDC